jgi:hypothetical protein
MATPVNNTTSPQRCGESTANHDEVAFRADKPRSVGVVALALAAVFALLGSAAGMVLTSDEFANLAHQLNAISYVCLLVYIGTAVGQASSPPSR